MKIGLKLAETGYRFGTEERARIYLTNALEPWVKQLPLIGFEALAHEAAAVNEIKRHKRFTVVIGNPPYSVLSANLTSTARMIVDPYRYVNGQKIEERSMLRLEMHLQDDYIKFLAFSQQVLDQAHVGVLGVITNNGYLDNLTLRGVRFTLSEQFRELALLNLHGSRQRRGRSNVISDDNVFDIEQGVTITTAAESGMKSVISRVRYAELIGSRELKNQFLLKSTAASIETDSITPQSPYYFFTPRDDSKRSEYDAYTSITEAMPTNISGIVTAHDHLVVDFHDVRLRENARILRSDQISDEKARELLGVKDNAGWKLARVRRKLRKKTSDVEFLRPYAYRPFDVRTIYYQHDLVWCDRRKVMSHTIAGSNVALATCRQLASEPWEHLFVTRDLQDDCLVSNRTRERSYHFPLYLYDALPFEGDHPNEQAKRPNFSSAFLKSLTIALKQQQVGDFGLPTGLTPEDILHYAYAVFHSPSYRSRYAEFLKIDFPRLPLTSSLELFHALARLGGELTALHLLESAELDQPIAEFIGGAKKGNGPEIEKISWSNDTVWIDKQQTTGFRGVREEVWNFHIGSYQVCQKWLKDRKGRTLTKDDIAYYHKIIVALSETIRLMAKIDRVIEEHGGWPLVGSWDAAVSAGVTARNERKSANNPESSDDKRVGEISALPDRLPFE
jgi:predicted helicase